MFVSMCLRITTEERPLFLAIELPLKYIYLYELSDGALETERKN